MVESEHVLWQAYRLCTFLSLAHATTALQKTKGGKDVYLLPVLHICAPFVIAKYENKPYPAVKEQYQF